MGAKGAGHKQCAIKCASAGIPVTLIEEGTEKSYILLPDKDASPLPATVTSRMEDEVTVTGKEYRKERHEIHRRRIREVAADSQPASCLIEFCRAHRSYRTTIP